MSYGIAALSVGMATGLTLFLQAVYSYSFLGLFYAAVAISARFGMSSGLLCTGLSTVAIHWFVLPPTNQFGVLNTPELVQLSVFILVTLLISSLSGELLSTKHRMIGALKKLQHSEAHYRRLIDTAYEGIWILTPDGKVDYANLRLARMLGYSVEDIRDRSVFQFIHGTAQPIVKQTLESQNPQTEQYELRLKRQDGSDLWTLISTSPIINESGEFQGTLGMLTDLSARKQSEAAIVQLNQNLQRLLAESQTLLDVIPIGIGIAEDPECKHIRVNRAFAKQLGIPKTVNASLSAPEDEKPSNFKVCRDGREMLPEELPLQYAATHGVEVLDLEVEVVHHDGTVVQLLEYASPLFDEQGNPRGSIGAFLDITQRKQSEAALRESEARFRHLSDTAPVLIWMAGKDKLCNFFNKPWLDFTGRTFEQELGNGWTEGVHPDDLALCVETYHTAFDARQEFKIEYRLKRSDGEYRWIFDIGTPRFTPEGKFLGYIGSCIDISDRKQAEAEMRQFNEMLEQRVQERTLQLEAVNKELESFSYSVSHDLRAPLRHISGFVELLQKHLGTTRLDETSQRYLHIISEATQQAGRLIDGLLDFSRMGRIELHSVVIDMESLTRSVQRELETAIAGRTIHWTIHPLLPVKGDPTLLRLVLQNLLENAIKYTRPKLQAEIEIGCSRDETQVIFYVRDNGIGFDMQYSPKLFGVFQRLHSNSEFEGSGIGLANVRRIIQRHGGQIWAEGAVNQGATFYFSLPKLLEEVTWT